MKTRRWTLSTVCSKLEHTIHTNESIFSENMDEAEDSGFPTLDDESFDSAPDAVNLVNKIK